LFNKQEEGEREIQNFNAWHLKYGREKKRLLTADRLGWTRIKTVFAVNLRGFARVQQLSEPL
jgi:hypothetical protein